jgi:hypothetical protein
LPSTPSAPAVPAAPATTGADAAGNVSSAQIDQKEINDIAQELKRGLNTEVVPPQAATIPVAAAPATPPSEATAQEGTIHLAKPKPTPAAGPAPDDTIYIDNEGVLHSADEEQSSQSGDANN